MNDHNPVQPGGPPVQDVLIVGYPLTTHTIGVFWRDLRKADPR